MAEVHPDPAVALSDSAQQMDIDLINKYMDEVKAFAETIQKTVEVPSK